jgi:hypothetical protein
LQIEIDTSKVESDLKKYIFKKMKRTYDIYQSNDIITILSEVPLANIKTTLTDILSRQDDEYIVTENSDNEYQLIVMKNGDVEQVGIYSCIHCGMMFKSDDERHLHSFIHYLM